MTVGERIQQHRKKLGLSQEELGQKLFVSRQTISLWEKDQTVPTIDNLMRLREILGVSVDEILGFENPEQGTELQPLEAYRFHFTKEELKKFRRLQRKELVVRTVLFAVLCVFLIVSFAGASASDLLIGLGVGLLLAGGVSYIKVFRAYNKNWKNSLDRLCSSTYVYELYGDFIKICVYRGNEKVQELKCCYSDVERIQQLGSWLYLQIGRQVFIARKSDLKENSLLFSHISKKTTEIRDPEGKWKSASWLLFTASLLSLVLALSLVATVSNQNKLFIENMWLFFLVTPIPIASVVLGFVLKKKGYRYKKNVIAGMIMAVLLCIYGSFSFLFAGHIDHSDMQLLRVEQLTGMDIPDYIQITTQNWEDGNHILSREHIYSITDVYFENTVVEEFEKQLVADERWLSRVPNDLIGITSSFCDHDMYDYVLIYNTEATAYNTLPQNSGTFRFINILYSTKDDHMMIVEYDMDYVKDK